VPKFRRAIPPNSDVISAPLLHFRPIFDSAMKKVVKGAPPPVEGALLRLSDSLACVKIWGRSTAKGRNMVFRKMRLGYVNMSAYNLVPRGPNFKKFFLFNTEKIALVNAA